ncbi:MAG: hypothetical protein RJA36_1710 [Pseudomonadota bacterium]
METRKAWLFAGAGLLLVVAAAIWRSEPWAQWPAPDAAAATLLLSGNIEAHTSVLSFKGVQSRIVQLPLQEGQSVRSGELLAQLDMRDLAQQVAVSEAAVVVQRRQLDAALQNVEAARKTVAADQATLAQRQLDLGRALGLQQQGFVSDAAVDAARTAVLQAHAGLERDQALLLVAERNVDVARAARDGAGQALELARLQRANATLVAPFDGVIVARQAELGEVVAPGTPVATLADLDHVWLRAYLNETDLGRVRLGQEVAVSTDAFPGRSFQGRLAFVAAQAEFTPKSVETHAERVTLVYRVKIDLDNAGHWLLPGMPADARLAVQAPR